MTSLENIIQPPHDLETESMVISQLLMDSDAIYKIIDLELKPQDFFVNDFRLIYSAILSLIGEKKVVDQITIKNKCGITIGEDIVFKAMSTSGIEDYAEIIKNYAIKREILKEIRKVEAEARSETKGVEKIKTIINNTLNACYRHDKQKEFSSQLVDFLEELYEEPTDILKTGYKLIDDKIRLSRGQLITIAGRPGMGKSAVMGCLALSMKNVAFFSLEMQNREVAYRMISSISGVPYKTISNGIKTQPSDIQEKVHNAFDKVAEKNISVYDKRLSLIDIRLELKKLKITKGIDVAFLDYLQLIKTTDSTIPRALQIGQITRELKSLAKELDIAIVIGSQLNRGVENRMNKTPKLADLRESGDIEQDSDIVCFIDRDREDEPDRISLIFEKVRNGQPGKLDLYFDGETMAMRDKQHKDNF